MQINKNKAIGNRLFLIKDNSKNQKSLLYKPPYSGVIISKGPYVKDPDLDIGTRITYTEMAGVEINIDNKRILSIRENDITSIIGSDIKIS